MAGKRGGGSLAVWLLLALLVVLLDQLSKTLVQHTLAYGQTMVLAKHLNLVLVGNPGAAFSFLAAAGGWQRWLFAGLAVVAALAMVWLLKRHADQKVFCFALSMLLGGAVGNLIDRLWIGHVVDFIDFYVGDWHWPTFNLADSAITLGAALLVLDELRRVSKSK
ncbi:MAG: signal peptidase II [Candidatus Protistobacter heckmanni]|nr:signal peptidase II [Candidatus Protistobacter heckmanni]